MTTKDNKKMTRTQIATADFSCGGMQKGTNGDESLGVRDCARETVIDNRHKHTIIATLAVKKGNRFLVPDAEFPRVVPLPVQGDSGSIGGVWKPYLVR